MKILEKSGTIAILGLSPKPERDSYNVAKYLKQQGYKIMPVRPAQREILEEKVFASLDEIHSPVDIANAFRNSEQILKHVPEILRLKPKVFWMQLGIQNDEAAELLTEAGIDVVMNRCIKVDHAKLINSKKIIK